MIRELQPHLLDPIEGEDGNVTQENENVRVTRVGLKHKELLQ